MWFLDAYTSIYSPNRCVVEVHPMEKNIHIERIQIGKKLSQIPLLLLIFSFIALVLLTSCNLAPRSERPAMPIPNQYKEISHWVKTKPNLTVARQGCPWWTVFNDPDLNKLQNKLTKSNPSLQLAYSRFQDARAMTQAARSQLYPTLIAIGGQARQQNSKNVSNVYPDTSFLYNTATFQGLLSYEVDIWYAIRNNISASAHAARASQFDLAGMELSLHATLADLYFELKGDNEIQTWLDRNVHVYEHAWRLVHQLHVGGALSAFEEDMAVSELEKAKTAATDMRLQRAELSHAIAVLVGDIPANFKLPRMDKPIQFVPIAPDLPCALLQQRPDVAAASQRVRSANATIGVARAAFLPNINLSALAGYQSQRISSLFSNPSLIWALGPPGGLNVIPPQLTQIVFDGYYLQANLKRAKAGYYEAVNGYRQTVLTAFQEVEDGLVATRRLDQEVTTQTASTEAAFRALNQVQQRMHDGMDTYLGVYQTENNAIQSKIALINLNTSRQLASIQLIKALGGGWKINEALKYPV